MLQLAAIAAAVLVAGGGVKLFGDGVNETANGSLKLAAAAGLGYLALKHFKVLK